MIKQLKVTIWEREFLVPVEYDCYTGEKVTKFQTKAMKTFLKNLDWIEASKHYVIDYCHDDVEADGENFKKDNIFSYIKPESFFVKRETPCPRVALMCKYRYDLEHGLAIVFSSDGTISVGSQDIIL